MQGHGSRLRHSAQAPAWQVAAGTPCVPVVGSAVCCGPSASPPSQQTNKVGLAGLPEVDRAHATMQPLLHGEARHGCGGVCVSMPCLDNSPQSTPASPMRTLPAPANGPRARLLGRGLARARPQQRAQQRLAAESVWLLAWHQPPRVARVWEAPCLRSNGHHLRMSRHPSLPVSTLAGPRAMTH